MGGNPLLTQRSHGTNIQPSNVDSDLTSPTASCRRVPPADHRIGRMLQRRIINGPIIQMKHAFLPSLALFLALASASLHSHAQEAKHNYAQWEPAIAAFVKQDASAPPPKGALLFIGSSTIARWGTLAADFPGTAVINRGFGGSEILDCTYFADQIVIPYAPRMVLLRSGVNDIHAGRTAKQVFEDYKAFGEKVHASLPDTKIVFISLSASIDRWKEAEEGYALSAMAKQYAAEHPGFGYIETKDIVLDANGQPRPELFAADTLHLSQAGYRLLTERVQAYLKQERQAQK